MLAGSEASRTKTFKRGHRWKSQRTSPGDTARSQGPEDTGLDTTWLEGEVEEGCIHTHEHTPVSLLFLPPLR